MICDVADEPKALILPRLPSVINFIQEALDKNGGVLVYCTDGVSRSAAIVIAYLMYCKRKTYSDAYAFVKLKRSVAKPNFGFVKQLQNFEKSLNLDKDLGRNIKSSITKQIIDKQTNLYSPTSLKMFRGLSPSSEKIMELASRVSLQVDFRPSNKNASVLESKTPIKNILSEDLNELAARNFDRANFSISKLT